MSGWLILILVFGGAALYLIILVRNYQAKERASNDRLDTHLTLLSSGFEKLAKENTSEITPSDKIDIANIKELWGYPPPKEIVIEEVVHGEQVPQDWDFAIHLHEASEQYLGIELFVSLENRVASIPGVDRCLHEDREVFLISSKNYQPDIMAELFWREFLHAAEIAHIQT